MDIEIILIEKKKVYYEYLEVLNIEISIPNLELLGITHLSVLNFQMRFFSELGYLLSTDNIFIRKTEDTYTYIFRINDYYSLNNISKIKPLGDFILNDFIFNRKDNKRKKIKYENEISKKIKLLQL